ncbi:hypothetical protein ACV357_35480, partial [Pseudomonas aeruginosa]
LDHLAQPGFQAQAFEGAVLQVVKEEREGIAAELLGMLHPEVTLAHQHGHYPCLPGKQTAHPPGAEDQLEAEHANPLAQLDQ